jgi:peptidoglycan/xylan/chitin deacetylase (PgdA/CDA1 family)
MAAPVILMYHSISPDGDDPFDITVRPARFEKQLRWLRRTGRTGASVSQLLAARERFDARRLVGLSFDDGYADFIEYALPLLQRYGFTATMFVPADQLGKDNDWDPEGPRKRIMTADELRQIADAGIEIGSHGFRHRSLPDICDAEVAEEIATSRSMLREITGQQITGFCYPYGHLDARAVHSVRDAGYSYGCSVWPTEYAGQFALAREYMRESDSARSLWNRGLRHWLKHEYRGPGADTLHAATDRDRSATAALSVSPGQPAQRQLVGVTQWNPVLHSAR